MTIVSPSYRLVSAMKEPGKFDLVYHNEMESWGSGVRCDAGKEGRRKLLFLGLRGRPFAWLAAGGLEGDTLRFPALLA